MAQRLGAAGEDQVRGAFADRAKGGVDRLHAGAAIDLHRERNHGIAHAEAKGCLSSKGRPHCTARSTGVNGPGAPRASRTVSAHRR